MLRGYSTKDNKLTCKLCVVGANKSYDSFNRSVIYRLLSHSLLIHCQRTAASVRVCQLAEAGPLPYKNTHLFHRNLRCVMSVKASMQGQFNLKATRGYWTHQRDKKLIQLIAQYGGKLSWNQLAKVFQGMKGKYLRERYRNHLDPSLKRTGWTWDQDQILKKCYLKYRNQWEAIAKYLPGRSANQIKNRTKRRQFRELFPELPKRNHKSRAMQEAMKNRVPRPPIHQQAQAIALKQEHNRKMIWQEILKDKEKDVVQEKPFPQAKQYKYQCKGKRFEQTTSHLQRTYQLIRGNLNKNNPSDFYLIFQTKTKREIFDRIKDIQWTITQLWPLLTNHTRPLSNDDQQEITFFLFCLIKADNQHANKILHRMLKCREEEYLLRKIENIIEDIDRFIRLELDIIKQQSMLEENNIEENRWAKREPNQEAVKRDVKEENRGETTRQGNRQQRIAQAQQQRNDMEQHVARSANSNQEQLFNDQHTDDRLYDFVMMGKKMTIANEMVAPSKGKVKLEHNPPQRSKLEQAEAEMNEQSNSNSSAVTLESIESNLMPDNDCRYRSQENEEEDPFLPQAQCIEFQEVDFTIDISLASDSQQGSNNEEMLDSEIFSQILKRIKNEQEDVSQAQHNQKPPIANNNSIVESLRVNILNKIIKTTATNPQNSTSIIHS